MNKYKVTKVLDFFFAFNYVEDSDSLEVFENEYEDDYFRWTPETLKHDSKLTAIVNSQKILLFSTEKVRERIVGNLEKVKSNDANDKFGCLRIVVNDLLMEIPFQELTDKDILEIDANLEHQREMNARNQIIKDEQNKQRALMEEKRKGYAKT